MMKKMFGFISTLLISAGLVVACKGEPEVASPVCAEYFKATDPQQKAELAKKCPRSGPDFKPSSGKKW